MSHHPTIAIVGSGPIGSAYARVLVERLPDARVVMFEAGPQLTRSRARASGTSPTPPRRSARGSCRRARRPGDCASRSGSLPAWSSRACSPHAQGTHLLDFGGEGSARRRPSPPRPPRRTSAGRARTGPAPPRRRRSARRSRSSPTTSGTTCSRSRRTCCTCRAPPSRTRRSGRASARCSRRTTPVSCPRATDPARFPSPAIRSPTARCAGPAPTSCSARSSIRPRRSASGSSCAI